MLGGTILVGPFEEPIECPRVGGIAFGLYPRSIADNSPPDERMVAEIDLDGHVKLAIREACILTVLGDCGNNVSIVLAMRWRVERLSALRIFCEHVDLVGPVLLLSPVLLRSPLFWP
jgi:hypothetical protein